MNRSKAKGTAAETAVVRYLLDKDWPEAERLALRGSLDVGDVRWTKRVHLEVKAGEAAHKASWQQCMAWLREADIESVNAGVPCYLVVKRKGHANPGNWKFFCHLLAWADGMGMSGGYASELPFADAVSLAREGKLKGFQPLDSQGFRDIGSVYD
jgi:hypothetical protein